MALTTPSDFNPALIKNLDMSKYVDLASFLNEVNKEDVRETLVKTYGKQGITGFLSLVGAVKAQATADEVTYWEEARLHQLQEGTSNGAGLVVTAASAAAVIVRENDVVLSGSDRFFVDSISGADITLVALDGSATLAASSAVKLSVEQAKNKLKWL